MVCAHSFQRLLASVITMGVVATTAVAQPSVKGKWGSTRDMKITSPTGNQPTDGMMAQHAILLHTGKVLCIDFLKSYPYTDNNKDNKPDVLLVTPPADPNGASTVDYVWDDEIESPSLPGDGHVLSCAAHCQLPDGRILFRGGAFFATGGNQYTTVFDPTRALTDPLRFDAGPDEEWLLDPNDATPTPTDRFYATTTLLGNGNVLVTDGRSRDATITANGLAAMPAILNVSLNNPPASWTWTPLRPAEYCGEPDASQPDECRATAPNDHDLNRFQYTWVLSGGKVFEAGSQWGEAPQDPPNGGSLNARKLNVSLGSWTDVAALPIIGGSAVMYGKNKILMSGGDSTDHLGGPCETGAGGNDPEIHAHADAYRIDASGSSGPWTAVAAMNHARVNHFLIALPDGKVLAIGGGVDDGQGHDVCDPANSVLIPEAWDPANPSNSWVDMAAATTPRWHHSSALLLPDGSVFTAGGQAKGLTSTSEDNFSIFYPPYFFGTTRPEIVSAPNELCPGFCFELTLDSGTLASDVTAVRLIRPGAVTHSWDMDQRSIELEYAPSGASTPHRLRVDAPGNSNLAPHGYYMLFVATGTNGTVPSKSVWVQVKSCTPSVGPCAGIIGD